MATVEVRINNGLDDTYLKGGTFGDDDDVKCGNVYGAVWDNALRFTNVTIPKEAIITAAYINLTCSTRQTGITVHLKISGNDVDNAVAPTSAAEFNALVKTAAEVSWNINAIYEINDEVNTPSLVDIIQEIVNRGSWASGNAMQIIISDASSDDSAYRGFYSFDSEPDSALLHVEYASIAVPSVATDPATELGAIEATPNGTLDDDGGEACDCGFEYGRDISYGHFTSTEIKTKGEAFSQVIHGLFPGTTYHFRAFATNSAGTSYGADRTFTTKLIMNRAYALSREEL